MRTLLLLSLVAAPGLAQDEPAPGNRETGHLTIKIDKELELKDFLDQVSRATGQTLIYDPHSQRIRGQKVGSDINVKVPEQRAFDAFRSILAFYELTLIKVGPAGSEMWLVMDSRSTNNLVKNKATWIDPKAALVYEDRDGFYVACAFPLQHVRNTTLVRTSLATMVSPAGIGRVHEYPGGIIVMDFAPNVAAISRILRQMDVEAAATAPVMETVELRHAPVDEVVGTLMVLLADPEEEKKTNAARRAAGAAPMKPRVASYRPRNAVAIYASREDAARIKGLIKGLDLPPAK